jgi:hypothetical protein
MTNLSILGIGEPGWKCDVGKPINNCKDGWVKPNFDDGKRGKSFSFMKNLAVAFGDLVRPKCERY